MTENFFGQVICRKAKIVAADDPLIDRVPEWLRDWHTGFEMMVEAGVIKKCDSIEELEGALAVSPRDLYSEDDFIMAARPDGTYSFMYPEDYFYRAVYDEERQDYELATSDGSVTLYFTEMDSPVQGDPYRCSNEIC